MKNWKAGIVLSVIAASTTLAQPFDRMVVFGDSLSDTGNIFQVTGGLVPESPPYFDGRFSNGPVWVEYLADSLSIPDRNVTNLALGGATTEAIAQLVDIHLASAPDTSNTLYVVWGGANNLLDILDLDPVVDPNQNFIQEALTDLAAAGAEHILVPNVPNLGQTPRILDTNDPAQIADATNNTIAFNLRIDASVDHVEQTFGIDIFELNTFSLIDQVVSNPAAFGYTNVTSPALLPNKTVVPNPDEFLFWDSIHPTTSAHAYLADVAAQTIPEPATLLMMLWTIPGLLRRPYRGRRQTPSRINCSTDGNPRSTR